MQAEMKPGDTVLLDRTNGVGMTVRYLLPRATEAALLRFAELFFQIFNQFFKALFRKGIAGPGGHPLGLFETPFQFFSVAVFIHGATLLL